MSLSLTASLYYKSAFAGSVAAFSASSSSAPTDVAFAVRSCLAQSPPAASQARSLISKHSSALGDNSTKALGIFADVVEQAQSPATGERDLGTQVSALTDINEGVEELGDHYDGEKEQIESLLATTQYLDEDPIGALETLKMGTTTQRNLGSLALGIHLLLLINRYDLASKEYEAARTWAEDSLVIQLIEAELGLYKGGRSAQQAYYVYDEFSSVSTTSDEGKGSRLASMKAGRGVGLMKRGEFSRAEESLREAATTLQQDGGEGVQSKGLEKEIQANLAVLALHLNPASTLANPGQEYLSTLSSPSPAHPLAVALSEMEKRFDEGVASRVVAASST